MRNAVHETQIGQRSDYPRHGGWANPFPDRQRTRRHRAEIGQRRQRRQLRQRHRGLRAAEPQLPGQPHYRQRQVAGQPAIALYHSAKGTTQRPIVSDESPSPARVPMPGLRPSSPLRASSRVYDLAARARPSPSPRRGPHRRRAILNSMSVEPGKSLELPPLPVRCWNRGRSSPSAHWPGWLPRWLRSSYRPWPLGDR